MKLDFWRFPSISCQERHCCIIFNRFAFPLGCFLCCLSHLAKNVREDFLLHMCSNPLMPDSSTSGAVTFWSQKDRLLFCSLFFHQWLLPPRWWLQPPVHSALESPCSPLALPKGTAAAQGRLCCTPEGTFSTSYAKSVHLPFCNPLAGGRTNRNGFLCGLVLLSSTFFACLCRPSHFDGFWEIRKEKALHFAAAAAACCCPQEGFVKHRGISLGQSNSWRPDFAGLAPVRDRMPLLRICLKKVTKQIGRTVSICFLLWPGSSAIWILLHSPILKMNFPVPPYSSLHLILVHAFLLITAHSFGNWRPC